MIESRITLNIALGYILGIIMGLYCKISIVLFYVLFFIIFQVIQKIKKNKQDKAKQKFRFFSFKRYSRYLKIIFSKKVIFVVFISSIFANSIVLVQNYKYDNLYKSFDCKEIKCKCVVVSDVEEKEYKNMYKVKVISINDKDKTYKNTYLYISIKKNLKKEIYDNLNYGQELIVKGKFLIPETQRNYKGFDYKEYLKTLKIFGIIEIQDLNILKEHSANKVCISINKLKIKMKNNIKRYFKEEIYNIFIGIVLGDKSKISNETLEDFSNSNISHILAVSGMHLGYVILIFQSFFSFIIGRRYGNILTSFVITVYIALTGFSPSVIRAGITGIILLLSEFFRSRNDTWENLSTSILIMLIYNPFLIKSTSFLLSYAGTIGIISLNKTLNDLINNYWDSKEKKTFRRKNKLTKKYIVIRKKYVYKKIEESFILTISAYLIIIPIMMLVFNKIAFLSILVAIVVGFVAVPTVVLGIVIFLLISIRIYIFLDLAVFLESIFIQIIISLSKLGTNLNSNNLTVVTPNICEIIIYYISLFLVIFLFKINSKRSLNQSEIRVIHLISLLKYRVNQKRDKILKLCIILVIILGVIKFIPKALKIHFIDVGQGDSTLIITPNNKKILIDGGGTSDKNFDVGKKILLPYLLDRRIKKIDYILISHFDDDHIGGILSIMSEIKIGKVIISNQEEDSQNFQKFKKIIKEKSMNVIFVKNGDVLNIEDNIKIYILWPREEQIKQNILNNNSIVAKFCYKDFSMLFTGDIENIAEREILKEYQANEKALKADILKVAHHGSKTSSTQEFIERVSPKIALIGVGKNNKFGHPNVNVLNLLRSNGVKVYRTDESGEITIEGSSIVTAYFNK